MTEARFVRWAVPLLLLGALVVGIGLPTPETLPAVALGTEWILYAERATLLFYGSLLLLVPLVRAMRGQLPIELSLRGARYEETKASEQALVALDDRLAKLEAGAVDSSALVVGLSQETRELERAEQLAASAAEGSPDAEARFDEALARLRRSAGIVAEPRRPHSTFGEVVRKTMLDRNWVVASHPKSRHTSIQPDFLVQAGDRRLLVEAKSRDVSRRSIERAAAMLMQAVEPFGADDAYVVVPDGQKAADLDVPVQVMTLSELRALA